MDFRAKWAAGGGFGVGFRGRRVRAWGNRLGFMVAGSVAVLSRQLGDPGPRLICWEPRGARLQGKPFPTTKTRRIPPFFVNSKRTPSSFQTKEELQGEFCLVDFEERTK